MAISEEKLRVQVIVSKETVKKIEELAELMDMSTSRMCARLLEEGINDNEWIIRKIAAPLRKIMKKFGGAKSGQLQPKGA